MRIRITSITTALPDALSVAPVPDVQESRCAPTITISSCLVVYSPLRAEADFAKYKGEASPRTSRRAAIHARYRCAAAVVAGAAAGFPGQADLMKSQLWAVRDKFEQRQAGGVMFYLRSDPQSQRTVAFLATRDDLVAQSLELLAGADRPNIGGGSWYRGAVAATGQPGELRLAINLEEIAKSACFRSY